MSFDSPIKLILRSGADAGKSGVFQSGEIIVGKDPRCDFVVNQVGVSRMHFRLEPMHRGWQLVDLRSTNGTMVDGVVVGGSNANDSSLVLTRSTQIRIGEAVLEVSLLEDNRTEVVQLPGLDSLATREHRLAGQPAIIPRADSGTHVFTVPPVEPQKATGSGASAKPPGSTNAKGRSNEISSEDEDLACTTLDHPSATLLPRPFRNYRLLKSIGVGGMGQVFLATQNASKEPVAIKFLKPQGEESEQNRARFLREMEITSSLQHASIVQLIECGDEAGQLFIAMEYCNGGNLADLLARSKQLTLRRSVRLMDRLLAGVELAHTLGIVHRDLKPQNIILHQDHAGKYKPKITDFGLAKSFLQAGESGMTTNGTVGGSWAYMPMEQLTNFRFVSPSSDIWSLGAIFYESITGRLPREHRPDMNPIRAILHAKIIPIESLLPNAPIQLVRFVHRCLDSDASKRFTDGSEMRKALRQLASQLDIEL